MARLMYSKTDLYSWSKEMEPIVSVMRRLQLPHLRLLAKDSKYLVMRYSPNTEQYPVKLVSVDTLSLREDPA